MSTAEGSCNLAACLKLLIAVMQQIGMTERQQRHHLNEAVPTFTLLTRSTTSIISHQLMLFLQANYSCTMEGVIRGQFRKENTLLS